MSLDPEAKIIYLFPGATALFQAAKYLPLRWRLLETPRKQNRLQSEIYLVTRCPETRVIATVRNKVSIQTKKPRVFPLVKIKGRIEGQSFFKKVPLIFSRNLLPHVTK